MRVQHMHCTIPHIASKVQLVLSKLWAQPLCACHFAYGVRRGFVQDEAAAAGLTVVKEEDDGLP